MTDQIYFEYDEKKLFEQAQERGFESIQAYLEALIEEDLPDPEDSLREALQEFREGKGRPVDEWLNEHD